MTAVTPDPDARVRELGLELPTSIPPVGNYVRAVVTGNLLFTSGHLPDSAGEPIHLGRLGDELTVEQGYAAARQAALNMLGTVVATAGSLGRVRRVVKLLGMVHSAPGFTEQPFVMNGASDLLQEVFGESALHARSAVGMAQLPRNNCVEIEGIFELAGV
jgi:enamine deaminase RidA (YjgF/YER057c/UK114 family)